MRNLGKRLSAHVVMVLAVMLGAAMPALGEDAVIVKFVPKAQKVGEGRKTFLFFDVFDATLYAPGGKKQDNAPFALKLHYLRDLDGAEIAKRSVEEMQAQGVKDTAKLNAWQKDMERIFPDVSKGTELIGVYRPQKPTVFFNGGAQIGEVPDPAFGEAFFNIWLGPKTTDPALRKQLLGV